MDHFLHEHPLTLDEVLEPFQYDNFCIGCREEIESSLYDCDFCLHKSCAELPRQIQSFFHPCPLLLTIVIILGPDCECNACFERIVGFSYCCEGCNFNLHVKCAQRPTTKESEGQELIQHFIHRHPLKLLVDDPNDKHLQVGCAICDNNLCSSSDPSAYICKEGCEFVVHKSCIINIPWQIKHFFHPSCPLILLTTRPYQCKGCDDAASGLRYSCGKCDFKLDLKCALLPNVKSKDATKIQHSFHRHPLTLHESKEFGSEVRCRVCRENCSLDPYFGCSRRSCDFFIHRKCALVELPQQIRHPFHSLHPLVLHKDLPYRCKVCDEDGYLAYCFTKCEFQLDVTCAFFPTIESKDADTILNCAHKHPLVALHESEDFGNEVRCRACAKSCLAPCFGCKECDFFLHKTCSVELQEKEILHPFHPLHPLGTTATS